MAKPRLRENRYDVRGGLNTVATEDMLLANELRVAGNARHQTTGGIGGIGNRTGSRRMHQTAIGGGNAITGLYQWDAPSGKQIVAVANGKLYYRNAAAGEWGAFTEVVPATAFSTTLPQSFAEFRGDGVGAALLLYIGDGTVCYSWNGSALTRRDGTSSFPKASLLASYHARLFANSSEYVKHLFYSKITDATDFTAGVGSLGGSQMVGVLTGEAVSALQTVDRGLLVASPDSIAVFSGFSAEDIRIEQDTEGLAVDVGVVGGQAIERVEKLAAFLSDLGPYLASAGGITPIGGRVENLFDAIDRSLLADSVVAFHKGRREVWVLAPGHGTSIMVYSLRLDSWTGPFTYPFNIYSLARYEDPSGDEYLIAGGSDGFIRHMDYGAKDDVLYDNSGGSTISWTVEYAPVFFAPGPNWIKQLDFVGLQASIPSGQSVNWQSYVDSTGPVSYPVAGTSSLVQHYHVDLAEQGGRFRFRVTGTNTDIVLVHGFSLEAWDHGRPM